MAKAHRNSLPPGYKLLWYEINKILGQGGFGITYLAHDMNLDRDVAIKEYLPVEIAVRDGDFTVHPLSDDHTEQYEWGLKRFISEARTLTKFRHPAIVRVDSVFEQNNSGYMVMQYEDGLSLQDKLTGGKTLDAKALQQIVQPLLDGLEQIHNKGFIHRDIKPDNIYLRKDGSPVLLDFGSARQALGEQTRTLTNLVTPGYAPYEQYYSKSDEQGAFTDIYGLGATLYRAVTGRAPLDAIERSKSIIRGSLDTCVPASEIARDSYPGHFLKAIDHALQFKAEERPQTIEEWRKDFDGTTEWSVSEQLPEVNSTFINITEPEPAISDDQDETDSAEQIDVNKIAGQTPSKSDSKPESTLSSPTLTGKVSTSSEASDIQPASHMRRIVLLILLMALFAGAYTGWQWYEKDKQAQTEKKVIVRAQRAEKERLAVEQKMEAERLNKVNAQNAEIEALLENAKRDSEASRLSSPVGNNAYDKYRQVLDLDPSNEKAITGIEMILDTHFLMFKETLEQQQLDEAAEYLEQIQFIRPDSTRLADAKHNLTEHKDKLEATSIQLEKEKAERQAQAQREADLERKRSEEAARLQLEKEKAERQAQVQREADLERKRSEEAKAQKSSSMSTNVYNKLTKARKLIAAKQYDQGLAALRALEKEKTLSSYEKAQIYYSLGFAQFIVNDYGEAILSYENVLKQAELPESLMINALFSLAQVYYDMTEYRKSLQSLKKVYKTIRENGENPKENLLQLMSANYRKLDDNNNLLNVFRRLAALYPKTDYWISIAETHSNLGQHDEQISIMERLYESGELSTAQQQINLAGFHILHGDPARTIEILEKGMADGLIQRSNTNLLLLSKAQNMVQGN